MVALGGWSPSTMYLSLNLYLSLSRSSRLRGVRSYVGYAGAFPPGPFWSTALAGPEQDSNIKPLACGLVLTEFVSAHADRRNRIYGIFRYEHETRQRVL